MGGDPMRDGTDLLVVEDDEQIGMVLLRRLEQERFHPVLATSAELAWSMMSDRAVDGAVIDIRLPGRDGWALIRWMRGDERLFRTPVVVLTGLLDPQIQARAESLCCEYLGKPFSAAALVSKLDRARARAPEIFSRAVTPAPTDADALDALAPSSSAAPKPAEELVTLVLADQLVEGLLESPDSLDGDGRVRVSQATLWSADGSREIARADSIEVERAQITRVLRHQARLVGRPHDGSEGAHP